MTAWTYILRCADGSYYVGSTTDIDRRLSQHQLGEGAAYTRRRRPVELVWCAEFERVDEAYWYEKQVQGWNRRKREALIRGEYELLPELASRSWAARRATGFRDGAGAPPQPPSPPRPQSGAPSGFRDGAGAPPQPPTMPPSVSG
ncbi:MAG: GIY-YIG nuclease family protein [Nocardioides sp.]